MFPVQLYRLDRRGSSILNEYTKIRQWNFDRKQYLCSPSFSFLFPVICLSFCLFASHLFLSILLSYFPMICFSFLVLPSFYALRQLLCPLAFAFFYTFCFLVHSRVNHIDKKVGKFPCRNESIFRFCIYLISTLNSVIFNK